MSEKEPISQPTDIYDCIIIGGGISGISFAHYMYKADKRTLVVEKSDRLGGQMNTNYSKKQEGFWAELGGHTCYNSYTSLLDIVDDIDARSIIKPLDSFKYVLYSSGKLTSLFSGVSCIPMAFGFPQFFFSGRKGKTIREYFRPKVGGGNYDRLFSKAFRAVICQPADDYPADLFLKRRKLRDKKLSRRFTFINGLSSFIAKIVANSKFDVSTSCEIVEITSEGKGSEKIFELKARNGKTFHAHNVAFATDPQTTARLSRNIAPKVSGLFADIALFESESINVTVPKGKITFAPIAGIIPLSDDFMSVVSRDLLEDDNLRSFTFHFEKGKSGTDDKLRLICSVLNIELSDIVEQASMSHTLPALRKKNLGLAKRVTDNSTDDDNIYFLGNYYYGLSFEDCVNRSLVEFDRFLSDEKINL